MGHKVKLPWSFAMVLLYKKVKISYFQVNIYVLMVMKVRANLIASLYLTAQYLSNGVHYKTHNYNQINVLHTKSVNIRII